MSLKNIQSFCFWWRAGTCWLFRQRPHSFYGAFSGRSRPFPSGAAPLWHFSEVQQTRQAASLQWCNMWRSHGLESCKTPGFLSECAWTSHLAQKVNHSLAESRLDLVARVLCGLKDPGQLALVGEGSLRKGPPPEEAPPACAGSCPSTDTRTPPPVSGHQCPGTHTLPRLRRVFRRPSFAVFLAWDGIKHSVKISLKKEKYNEAYMFSWWWGDFNFYFIMIFISDWQINVRNFQELMGRCKILHNA